MTIKCYIKKIFKIDGLKKIVNKTVIQKINSNDKSYIINNKTKLQKVIETTSNKIK